MRRGTLLSLVLMCSFSQASRAYEGAGAQHQEEQEQPAPKQPQLTKAPTIVKPVEAPYPPELLAHGAPAGSVKLIIEIDATGHVPNAAIEQSSGYPAFDQAALTAIKQFLFTPAELDGKPAAIQLEYVFHFQPPPPPPPPPPPDAPPPPKPVNFKGRVLERGTRDPLAGATVYLPAAKLQAETNGQGEFEIRGAPIGEDKVVIVAPRHRKYEGVQQIKPGTQTILTVYVWKQIEGANEITIRAQRDKTEVAQRTLEKGELTSVPGTFGDPVRVIQNLPGLLRAPYLSGVLLVRGSQPQDTSAMIDGVPIPLLFHFGGGPSVVNPSFIDKIDFIPGAYGAKYGRAIAGIVDIETTTAQAKAYHGDVSIDLLQSSLYLEGPVAPGKNWGSWSIGARRSYLDLFLPSILSALQQGSATTFVAAPRYWDYQARYSVEVGKNKLNVEAFGSDDLLTLAEAGTADTQGINLFDHMGFHRVRAQWSRNLGNGWAVSLAPTIGTGIIGTSFNDTIDVNDNSIDGSLRGALMKEFSERLKFETGIDCIADHHTLSFALPLAPDFRPYPGYKNNTITNFSSALNVAAEAVYATVQWNPWRGLKLIPGVRADLYQQPERTLYDVEPRLAARYEFTHKTAVKAAWGIYHEAAQPQNLVPGLGNPLLGLSRSEQTDIGFEQRLLPKLSLDVEGYYNWRTGLVVGASTIGEHFNNSGYGQAYGLEVLLKQDLTERMYGWVAYTLQRSEQKNTLLNEYVPVRFDQTHILTIVGSYKFDHGIEVGGRFRLTTGEPQTPYIGSTFDSDRNRYSPVPGPAGSVRGPTFNQLDVRVEKVWTFERWKFSAYLDVQNVYNAENPELLVYDYRYEQSAPVRGLPILPTLGVTGSF